MDLIQLGGPSRLPLPTTSTSRRPWTAEEDAALCAAVKQWGSDTGHGSSWAKISNAVGGGRTNKDCRKRWFYTLDPSLRKGRWTRDEDATLRQAYSELGPQWREIASRIPGRNDEQIAKRWKDVLSPDLSLDTPWTDEEDFLLLRLFKEMGPKWTPMSDHFPGRNGIACRNRFRKFKSIRPSVSAHSPNNQIHASLDQLSGSSANATNMDVTIDPGNQSISQDDSNLKKSEFPLHDHDQGHEPGPSTMSRRQSLILQQWLDATFGTDHNEEWIPPPSFDFEFDFENTNTNTESESVLSHNQPIDPLQSQSQSQSQSQAPPMNGFEVTEPIANAWGLLVALDAGQETLLLTAGLVRQLLADASRS